MNLSVLVPALKRAVAPPGQYDALFPASVDSELEGLLADALAEVQFDGFLSTSTLDVDANTVTPDLSTPQMALVVLYAMARHLTARISNLKSHTRYKAGNVEAETDQAASVLVQLLKETSDRKKQILEDARAGALANAFWMADMYVAKSIDLVTPELAFIQPALDLSFIQPGGF